MGEVVNALVAFAVIVFIFKWATSSSSESSEQRQAVNALGFRPKRVTQDMVNTISNMFPDIPADNIRYDLLRTGSISVTTNKILERGFLDAPPAAYHALYPPATNANGNPEPTGARATTTALPKKKESLITRYGLEERVKTDESIKLEEVGGKAVWEDDAKKREASLRERKAQMILAARQRLQELEAGKSSPPSV